MGINAAVWDAIAGVVLVAGTWDGHQEIGAVLV